MSLHPHTAATSIAGIPRAAVRGGTLDGGRQQIAGGQSVAAKPAGKSADATEIDTGNQTGDRRGDGRQSLDTFERSGQNAQAAPPETSKPEPTSEGRLDYQA